MRALAAVLGAAAVLSGCAEVGKLAAAAIDPPKLTFKSVNVRSFDLEGVTLGFDFDVENRNSFGLKVARVTYGIEMEGTRVLTGDAPGGLSLPAQKKVPLTFTARVRFRDVPGIASVAGKRDSIRYRLAGSVGVDTPVGILDLPVSHEDTLALPKMPRFSLDGLSIRSFSLTRLALDVRLRIGNPNAFALPAGQLDAALSLGTSRVARVENRPLTAVRSNGSVVVTIPIDLDLAEAGRAAQALARGSEVQLGIKGEADLAGAKLPIDLASMVKAR
jgi:LEA14-like dessication related protein